MENCLHTPRGRGGFTLIELTVAVAIFALVLAGVAQALVSYRAAMLVQRDRVQAAQHCASILSQMRAVRSNTANDPLGAVVAAFPDGSVVFPNNAVVDVDLIVPRDEVGGTGNARYILPNEQITLNYIGNNPQTDNPLEVELICTWTDSVGRPVRFSMSTFITDL